MLKEDIIKISTKNLKKISTHTLALFISIIIFFCSSEEFKLPNFLRIIQVISVKFFSQIVFYSKNKIIIPRCKEKHKRCFYKESAK